MTKPSPFRYFETSPEIIRLAVMLYIRFPLSLWNVEDMLHEWRFEICHETVGFWWNRFGPMFASETKKRRIQGLWSSKRKWQLDEVYVKINGETHYLWRAVEHEGEVRESYVTTRWDRKAAWEFLRKLMREHCQADEFVTEKLKSYGAAFRDLNASQKQRTGRWENDRVENSHLPFC